MENIDEQINLLATDITILVSEIKEVDGFISLCDDSAVKHEYMLYKNSLIDKSKIIGKQLSEALKSYLNSKPDPIKLHYKILYKKLGN